MKLLNLLLFSFLLSLGREKLQLPRDNDRYSRYGFIFN